MTTPKKNCTFLEFVDRIAGLIADDDTDDLVVLRAARAALCAETGWTVAEMRDESARRRDPRRCGAPRYLTEGDEVQVAQVIAATGWGQTPDLTWTKGYRFVRYEEGKDTVMVKDTSPGVFEGCEYRFDANRIRVGGRGYENAGPAI